MQLDRASLTSSLQRLLSRRPAPAIPNKVARKVERQPVFLRPQEAIVFSVALPPLASVQRKAAATFAVEDLIASPLEEVRVALGPEYPAGSGRWLVAVARSEIIEAVEAAGAPVFAAQMRLPVPETGWVVCAEGDLTLIRKEDGSGLCLPARLVGATWAEAGNPPITLMGNTPVPALAPTWQIAAPLPGDAALLAFDMSANADRGETGARWKGIRAGVAVVAGLTILNLGLALADLAALGRFAESADAKLTVALLRLGAPAENPTEEATRLLAQRGDAGKGVDFLSLLTRVLASTPDFSHQATLGSVQFNEESGALVLAIQAVDIPSFQAIQNRLVDAGFILDAGPVTSRDGAAEALLTVRAGNSN